MEQNIGLLKHEIANGKFSDTAPPKPPVRVFKGKTEFVLDYTSDETLAQSKAERHFYQRMLRAYLKGKTHFHFGFEYTANFQRIPKLHKVEFAYE